MNHSVAIIGLGFVGRAHLEALRRQRRRRIGGHLLFGLFAGPAHQVAREQQLGASERPHHRRTQARAVPRARKPRSRSARVSIP